MDALGWDSCDIIIVTGDAYVDHPSFWYGYHWPFAWLKVFRVNIAQPKVDGKDAFMELGET